jgi:DNA-binding CsgD family transcriptional regulator
MYSVFRWAAGFLVIALAGLLTPPRSPVLLALVLLGVVAYNGPIMFALNHVDNRSLLGLVRGAAALDILAYFCLLAVFFGSPPAALYGVFPAITIEAVAFDGTLGAIYSTLLFAAGIFGLQVLHGGVGAPSASVVLWIIIVGVIATSLAITDQVLLGGAPTEDSPAAETLRAAPPVAPAPASSTRLSQRELEVLKLVAAGYSNAMIASRLHLSENTVKGHVEALLIRLNARNRAEAVAAAARLELI